MCFSRGVLRQAYRSGKARGAEQAGDRLERSRSAEVTGDLLSKLRKGLPREDPSRLQYTRQAFRMLPALQQSQILDVGCGPGGPTMGLARLGEAQVIGVDVHGPYLHILAARARRAGLADRVHPLKSSMLALGFRDESLDAVWAEGSIQFIGFEEGLRAWRRLLRPGGSLVVHDMVWLSPDPPPDIYRYWKGRFSGVRTVPARLEQILACGYDPVGHFSLPEDAWWNVYYGPLEARIQEFRETYGEDAVTSSVPDGELQEIDMFKRGQKWYGSAFFVMQKRS